MLREDGVRGEQYAGAGLAEHVFDLSWPRSFVDNDSHRARGERAKIGGYRFRATFGKYGDTVATLHSSIDERGCHRRRPIAQIRVRGRLP